MYAEITKTLGEYLVGSDKETLVEYKQEELCERAFHNVEGVIIQVVYNYIGGITQYYIRDINA